MQCIGLPTFHIVKYLLSLPSQLHSKQYAPHHTCDNRSELECGSACTLKSETDLHVPPLEDGSEERAQTEASHFVESIQ